MTFQQIRSPLIADGTIAGADIAVPLTLGGALYIGSANERIRNPPNSATNLSVESSDGFAFVSSKNNAHLSANLYYDGSNWQRFDTAQPGSAWIALAAGGAVLTTVAAGANPASTVQKASFDINGNFSARDILANRGDGSGVVYFDQQLGSKYLYYNGSIFSLTGALNLGGGLGVNTNPVAGMAIELPNAGIIDCCQGSASGGQTIGVGGVWYPFGASNNFSGVIFCDETVITGRTAIFTTGGTVTLQIGAQSNWSATKDTASSINVYCDPGGGYGIAVQNNMGSAAHVQVMGFKLRGTQ